MNKSRLLAAAFAVVSVFGLSNFTMVAPAEAACKSGYWQNKDGTCTLRGNKHCNVRGVNWQCPSTTATCRLTKDGEKLCLR
jgi:hypothetical protein